MTTRQPRDEAGGYGAGNLVGSDRSGVRSAFEAREATDTARRRAHAPTQPPQSNEPDNAQRAATDLGPLVHAPLPGRLRAGTPSMDDLASGTPSASTPRNARDDADRVED